MLSRREVRSSAACSVCFGRLRQHPQTTIATATAQRSAQHCKRRKDGERASKAPCCFVWMSFPDSPTFSYSYLKASLMETRLHGRWEVVSFHQFHCFRSSRDLIGSFVSWCDNHFSNLKQAKHHTWAVDHQLSRNWKSLDQNKNAGE